MRKPLTDEQSSRVERQLEVIRAVRKLLPAAPVPYFAHLRVRTFGRESDVLLSTLTKTVGNVSLVDWEAAPLAGTFFESDEGEDFELSLGERALEGTVLEKNLVRFEAGELVELGWGDERLGRTGDEWHVLSRAAPRLAPRPKEAQERPHSPIDVVLDAHQRRVVELPKERSVLVLGEAGCGKTTVALHRLALLKRREPTLSCAVVVPTDGLRRLTETLLERLGVSVETFVYDDWAAKQARRAFPDLPKRRCEDAPAAVVRMKRHPAVREVMKELAARPAAMPDEDRKVVPSKAHARREDLQHLFGDRVLMERVAQASGGSINLPMVADVLEHTRVQFLVTAEEEFAHVDPERLVTVDLQAIDAGTPMEVASTVDAEDFAVLFELDRQRAALNGLKPTEPKKYDCLLIDEAQELAPLELTLLGRSVAEGGTLIVAGDAGQQVDPTTAFIDWDATMAELGVKDFDRTVLGISYRCPPDVTALARRVLGTGTEEERERPNIAAARFANDCHLVTWLTGELSRLRDEDPSAAIAVVTRTPEAATRLGRLLKRGVALRLTLNGEFTFRPGIDVTCVQEVKGLEFDHVIVPDANVAGWPDTPEGRRALYVAVTRPTHKLALAAAGGFASALGQLAD